MPTSQQPLLIWGAPAIAAYIGRPLRTIYHLLDGGQLPGAQKIGGRWCLNPERLARALDRAEADRVNSLHQEAAE